MDNLFVCDKNLQQHPIETVLQIVSSHIYKEKSSRGDCTRIRLRFLCFSKSNTSKRISGTRSRKHPSLFLSVLFTNCTTRVVDNSCYFEKMQTFVKIVRSISTLSDYVPRDTNAFTNWRVEIKKAISAIFKKLFFVIRVEMLLQ